jgi:hypothetical protein
MLRPKILALALLSCSVSILLLGAMGVVHAQAVVQSYSSDSTLEPGMIVQLDTKNSSKVLPATEADIDRIHGVIVPPNDAPVSLQDNTTTQQYYVATDGTYQVLVSDQNGSIGKGDYITVSSLAGVGMKANPAQSVVLGKALDSFDGSSNIEGTMSLQLGNGHQTTVHLGRVSIDISIAHNPLYQPSTASNVQDQLQKFGNSIAHKPVSLVRIYISVAIFLAAVGIAGTMLITGVRSSLVAVGRNPLAKAHIIRGLIQVTFTSLIIFVVGVFGVYLLLKL